MSADGPGKVATLPPDMQADHLRKVVKSCKQYSKMTDLELDEISIKGEQRAWNSLCMSLKLIQPQSPHPLLENMLIDTATVKVERKIENLVDFVKTGQSFEEGCNLFASY
jgi:hypothetical protein